MGSEVQGMIGRSSLSSSKELVDSFKEQRGVQTERSIAGLVATKTVHQDRKQQSAGYKGDL